MGIALALLDAASVPTADAMGIALALLLPEVGGIAALGVLFVGIAGCDALLNESTEIKRIAKTAKVKALERFPGMILLCSSSINDYKGLMEASSVGQLHAVAPSFKAGVCIPGVEAICGSTESRALEASSSHVLAIHVLITGNDIEYGGNPDRSTATV